MATKKTKQDDEPAQALNPNLTASMPGAVLDHDQARMNARQVTARMNGRAADAVVSSAGASSSGDVVPSATPTSASAPTDTSS